MAKSIRDNFIIMMYAFVLASMLIFTVYGGAFINYIRYIYALFIMVYCFYRYRTVQLNKTVLLVTVLYVIHTLLFGFLLADGSLRSDIIDNGKEMFIFWVFVFFTSYYVTQEHKWREFLIASFLVSSLFINYMYVTHFNGWAPIKFLPNMLGIIQGGRVRFTMGFISYNQAAYFSLVALILCMIVWRVLIENKKIFTTHWTLAKFYIFISGIIAILVILSAQTRGALLAAGSYWFLGKILKNKYIYYISKKMKWWMWFIVILAAIAIYARYVFIKSDNRSNYLLQNYEIFTSYYSKIIGMGYMPFAAFLTKAFEQPTPPLDSYYLYIICTTGFLGFAIIVVALVELLCTFLKKYYSCSTDKSFVEAISLLFIINLFISISEASMVFPFGPYSYIYWILYFVTISYREKKVADKEKKGYIL